MSPYDQLAGRIAIEKSDQHASILSFVEHGVKLREIISEHFLPDRILEAVAELRKLHAVIRVDFVGVRDHFRVGRDGDSEQQENAGQHIVSSSDAST
jgi:hypothetical protein